MTAVGNELDFYEVRLQRSFREIVSREVVLGATVSLVIEFFL